MAKASDKKAGEKNGDRAKPAVSKLGKELSRIRQQYIDSGGKLLNRRELEREIAERRGLR
jgi:hypothetical protein